ncbi:MAG: hypothetical protein NTZ33_04180 [Bacteroidetes bacterium]|nr:hypothetical protein [Bacteroidota bacterium]
MQKSYLYFIALIFIISCKAAPNPKEMFLKRYKAGEIINKVECKSNADQSYCLYLPKKYDIKKQFPVIYAFDPHGDGSLPVSLLTSIAEKYGYVVIGSNNSRNGLSPDDLNYVIAQLLWDTKTKLAIDTNRIYLVGFSGGARIAASLATSMEGVKGVIACSAGYQPGNAPAYPFIGISSYGDMNYLEMKKLDNTLQQMKANAYFMLFEGKHEWPPQTILNEAFTMLEINAVKDKSLVNDYLNTNTVKANKLIEANTLDSLVKAFHIMKRTIAVLDQLTDVSQLKATFSSLAQKPEVLEFFKEESALEAIESQKQQEFVSAFDTKNDVWWNAELKKLDMASSDKNSLNSNMAKRLKTYISLSCYSYSNRALQSQNWKYAALYTHIYQKVDPENSDCYYAMACLYANTDQKEKAIAALQTAIKFGFSNKNKLQNDPMLSALHGMPEFDKLLSGQ